MAVRGVVASAAASPGSACRFSSTHGTRAGRACGRRAAGGAACAWRRRCARTPPAQRPLA